jgi:hypothetical protein
VARSLQTYLIFAILSVVPDRQRTLRELELGRTLVREGDRWVQGVESFEGTHNVLSGLIAGIPVVSCFIDLAMIILLRSSAWAPRWRLQRHQILGCIGNYNLAVSAAAAAAAGSGTC